MVRILAPLVIGVLVLSIASQITVPMTPVPMTLQSLAVLAIGSLLGWRSGLATVLVWLVCAAMGLPLLADGTGGWQRFAGPTAGYLAAFPVAVVVAGLMAESQGRKLAVTFAAHLVGHAVLLAMGVAWLQKSIGWQAAIQSGASPFIVGMVVKSAAGGLIVLIAERWTIGRKWRFAR